MKFFWRLLLFTIFFSTACTATFQPGTLATAPSPTATTDPYCPPEAASDYLQQLFEKLEAFNISIQMLASTEQANQQLALSEMRTMQVAVESLSAPPCASQLQSLAIDLADLYLGIAEARLAGDPDWLGGFAAIEGQVPALEAAAQALRQEAGIDQ